MYILLSGYMSLISFEIKDFHLKKMMKNDALVAIPAALVLKAAIIIITDLYALECHGKYGR